MGATRTASCSCGQLRIEVQGEPRGIGLCHCLECQRRTGSVFAALASFAAPYTVTGTATNYERAGDQGARFVFRFCPVCGSTVFQSAWTAPSASQSALSATRCSRRRRFRFTTAAAITGCNCRRAR